MQKRSHGYQIYEPTDQEPDYGELKNFITKRNAMSLGSFFSPGDLDYMFRNR